MLKATLHSLHSGGWIANLIVGVALFLILSGVGNLINTPKSKLYGAALGITILFWVVVLTIGNRMQAGDASGPAESPIKVNTPAVPESDLPPEQSNKPHVEPPQDSMGPATPLNREPLSVAPKESPMSKKDKADSISQTMTNSPGGIQAGRDVTIYQGPQPRILTAQQIDVIARELRKYGAGAVEVFEIGDPEATDFAHQFLTAIHASGWQISRSRAEHMVPMPFGLILRVPSVEAPEAIALRNALTVAGLQIEVRIRPDIQHPSLLVGLRK